MATTSSTGAGARPLMKRDDFFRGLFAALRLRGLEFVDTQEDRHHARFTKVASLLRERRADFPEVPQAFVPSPFTSRYRELDDALLRLQRGLLGAKNPFYPGLYLHIKQPVAQEILNEYTPEQRKLFLDLADAYQSAPIDESCSV